MSFDGLHRLSGLAGPHACPDLHDVDVRVMVHWPFSRKESVVQDRTSIYAFGQNASSEEELSGSIERVSS